MIDVTRYGSSSVIDARTGEQLEECFVELSNGVETVRVPIPEHDYRRLMGLGPAFSSEMLAAAYSGTTSEQSPPTHMHPSGVEVLPSDEDDGVPQI